MLLPQRRIVDPPTIKQSYDFNLILLSSFFYYNEVHNLRKYVVNEKPKFIIIEDTNSDFRSAHQQKKTLNAIR